MIHEIGKELEAVLRTAGCPLRVDDGPESTQTTTFGRERIVIEHVPGGDSFGPTRSQHVNPDHRMTWIVGCKVTIYAQSPSAGARPFEHRRRASRVLNMVLVGLEQVARTNRNAWRPTGGGFVTPADLAASEAQAGAVYELTFTYDRPVVVQTWAGESAAEFTLGANGITSITKVSRNGVADDDDDPNTVPASAETACGA